MSVLVKGGTIVTALDTYKADIFIEDGRVKQIGSGLRAKATETLDATDKYILPGGIEPHCHTFLRLGDTRTIDDFETVTKSAAHGGTTTILDFAMQTPGRSLAAALERWQARAAGKAVIDYGFHLIVTDVETALEEIPQMVEAGVTSFKFFMAYKGTITSTDDGELYRAMVQARRCGALTMVHAENGDINDAITKEMLAQGMTGPVYTSLSHPPLSEGEATGRACEIAAIAEAPIYIVHVSCVEALEKVKAAREKGWPVFAETCPHYLVLSLDKLREAETGYLYVVYTPLRDKAHQGPLWRGLAQGYLQSVGTDHCSFNLKDKQQLARGTFDKMIPGLPGIETRLYVLYTVGVLGNKITLNRLVEVTSTTPAKLFGLYPMKGTIAVNSDADIVVFDPEIELTLRGASLHDPGGYTVFDGFHAKGAPSVVLSRGEVVVKEGRFIGKAGAGQYLHRKPFGYAYGQMEAPR